MKITFLCGSLEPGHDGVGDYTRRLAVELILQAHQITIIALNDKAVSIVTSNLQFIGYVSVLVLRIPNTFSDKDRYIYAQKFISDFNPDIISLQFVIFSFHHKGLPYFIVSTLKNLVKKVALHIMFHELWVGMPTHSSKKHIIWGLLQKKIISNLISKLKPRAISTQTHLYQKQLLKIGFNAHFLPLFSNIPYNNLNKFHSASNCDLANQQVYNLVVFGTIHPYSKIENLIQEVIAFMHSSGREVCLHAIGHCGPELEKWERKWTKAGLTIRKHGIQSPEQISSILSNCSAGITTTALPMIQKSGSVAAMHEHGLPVVCISGPWQPRNLTVPLPPLGVFELERGVFDKCIALKLGGNKLSTDVASVAQIFLHMIETYYY